MADYSELKKLAIAAFGADRSIDIDDTYGEEIWFGGMGCGTIQVGRWYSGGEIAAESWPLKVADAKLFAAMTPELVVEILAENERLTEQVEQLESLLIERGERD